MAKWEYKCYAKAHDEATLVAKLDAHGEAVYERPANARGEAMHGQVYQ